jgi:hypothetical protein
MDSQLFFAFSMRKFVKTKKFLQKNLEKISAVDAENPKTSSRRRERRRLTPLFVIARNVYISIEVTSCQLNIR